MCGFRFAVRNPMVLSLIFACRREADGELGYFEHWEDSHGQGCFLPKRGDGVHLPGRFILSAGCTVPCDGPLAVCSSSGMRREIPHLYGMAVRLTRTCRGKSAAIYEADADAETPSCCKCSL